MHLRQMFWLANEHICNVHCSIINSQFPLSIICNDFWRHIWKHDFTSWSLLEASLHFSELCIHPSPFPRQVTAEHELIKSLISPFNPQNGLADNCSRVLSSLLIGRHGSRGRMEPSDWSTSQPLPWLAVVVMMIWCLGRADTRSITIWPVGGH